MNNISKKDIEHMKSIIAEVEDKKEKADFSKKVVFGVICFVILFAIAVLFVFLKTGAEPTVLVGSVMAFASVELWSLSKIKRGQDNNEYRDN